MLLEPSITLLENNYSTGVTHDNQNIFIAQFTGRAVVLLLTHIPKLKVSNLAAIGTQRE